MIVLIVAGAVIVLGIVGLLIFRSRSRANDEKRGDEAIRRRG